MQVGDTVTFQLLRRSRTSIIPLVIEDDNAAPSPACNSPTVQTQDSASARSTSDAVASPALFAGGRRPASAHGSPAVPVWVAKPAEYADGHHAEPAAEDAAAPPDCNRFAKFTATNDAAPLWQRAARELAQYAAQVGC